MSDSGNATPLINTAPHEFEANAQFTEYGLEPFFACDRLVDTTEDQESATFTLNGEQWEVTIDSYLCGLLHPGETLANGTPFPAEEMREFPVEIQCNDDPVGERYIELCLRPRWAGQESSGGAPSPSVPSCIEEGVNLHIQGKNVEFTRYLLVIRRAFAALGLDSTYFSKVHETSTVVQVERYVRVHEDRSGPLFAFDGPLNQLSQVMQNDRNGRKRVDQRNTDEHGRNVPGYYNTVHLSAKAIVDLFPDHALPKVVKHYHSRETASFDCDEALSHPKLCVRYQSNLSKEKVGMATNSLERLTGELEETLLSILHDADLPVRPGLGTYVDDAYFEATESVRKREIIDLQLDRIRDQQSRLTWRFLANNRSPVAKEVLTALVSDGSKMSPKDLAERTDRHVGSVRRALRKMSDIVDRCYGEVALRSPNIAALVNDTLRAAERDTTDEASKDETDTHRERLEAESALFRWKREYGVEFETRDTDGRLTVDLGVVDRTDISRLLREGFAYWKAASRPKERFQNAVLAFSIEQQNDTTYLPDPEPQEGTGVVGRWLARLDS